MDAYADFLARKAITDPSTGLASFSPLPEKMFPFQRDITAWALRRGRAALFEGTGLGKSFQELAWADAVCRETGRDILHLAPLAVTGQMVREADKFGIAARQVRSQADVLTGTNITNYQKLEHFDLSRFGGVILDESSILKNESGHYRTALIEACQQIPFRLAATATPAPNDFMELGNHAEFLGVMSYTDMLATFFTHDGGETQKWRLKGHAENDFWKWMASWAVMIRKPSDLGYSDEGYDLPPLHLHQHTVGVDIEAANEAGFLFAMPAQTLAERQAARRDTVEARVERAFSLIIGNICDKLAECGSQNTPHDGAPNIKQTPLSASVESLNAETPTKILSTCENIIEATPVDLSEPQNNKPKLMSGAGKGTLRTRRTEKNAKDLHENAPLKPEGPVALNPNTELAQANTTALLQNKVERVPSAEISQNDASTLTIAIEAAKSEGFFAARAIPALDISRMTRGGLIEPWCIWCNLNSEQDALAKALGPLAFSVSGSMPDDQKEAAILGWVAGERPIMISKPSIMGFGMNFQHCRNTIFVGLNDSWEQYYQSVRRFWRFGQTQPVHAHLVAAETEGNVVANLRRKEADADRMAAAMVRHMADLSSQAVRGQVRDTPDYNPQKKLELPAWLME